MTAQPQAGQQMNFAALHANGTGPFIITEHQAGVRTIFKKNPHWWGKPENNFDEVIFTTISNDATRVAALLSGDVDWADPSRCRISRASMRAVSPRFCKGRSCAPSSSASISIGRS